MPGQKQYDNTNRFALFPNANMRDDKNDPDLQGFINIDGKEYWFKGWTTLDEDDQVKVISGVIGDEREMQHHNQPAAKKATNKRAPAKSKR